MASRTFGWIENANRLDKLRYIVGIFVFESVENKNLINEKLPFLKNHRFLSLENYENFIEFLNKENIEIPYSVLKGKGLNGAKRRSEAMCSGIIQACITAHSSKKRIINNNGEDVEIKKPYVDDWSADCYLRWAVSTGLINYNSKKDTCRISQLGIELTSSIKGSEKEKEVFAKALLSYPPVCRVLDMLSDKKVYTKFEIGSNLGFKGEMGFTSIPQKIFVYDYCTETNEKKRKHIKSNMEGDADKYARTIANWLVQMGWLESVSKNITETYFGTTYNTKIQAWKITRDGEKALLKSKGNSRHPQIAKIVHYEMLATKIPDANYVRLRRATILEALKTKKTLNNIQEYLKNYGLNETIQTIEDDISNFKNIGVNVKNTKKEFKLDDKIVELRIPANNKTTIKPDITLLKDAIRTKLNNINHDYLVLIDLAYSDADNKKRKNADAKEFEIQTANLLTKELDFKGEYLGSSNRPDVIIYYNEYGTIIDTKSYKDGFSVDKKNSDEMNRYVMQGIQKINGIPENEWWKHFDKCVTNYSFLFVTSFLKGNYSNNINEISCLSGINGGAIGVENLLYLAELLKSGNKNYDDFFTMFNNDEIKIANLC